MGLPLHLCGSGAFHLMFLSGPQVEGADFSAEIPSPVGPRNPGQSSADSEPEEASAPIARTVIILMKVSPMRRTIALHTKRRQGGAGGPGVFSGGEQDRAVGVVIVGLDE